MTNASAPTLVVTTAKNNGTDPNFQGLRLGGLTLTRPDSLSTQIGGNGLVLLAYQPGSPYVFDVTSVNNFAGFVLGPSENGVLVNTIALNNYGDGYYLTDTGESNVNRWSLVYASSANNEGWGVHAVAEAPGRPLILGHWYQVDVNACSAGGVALNGFADRPISGDFQLNDSIFGQDGGNELALSTYSLPQDTFRFRNVYIELAGTQKTGRTWEVPAKGIGSDIITFGPNHARMILSDVAANSASWNGIDFGDVGIVEFDNVAAINNGYAGAGMTGLKLGNFTSASIIGGAFRNGNGNSDQQVGIHASTGNNLSIINTALAGNSASGLTIDSNSSAARITNVTGI